MKLLGKLAMVCAAFASLASAAEITLSLVNTYPRQAPFGLAFDGNYIYWSNNNGVIRQMTTAGVDTGIQWTGPYWSELAWDQDRKQLAVARLQQVSYFDVGGGNQTVQNLVGLMSGITSLQDGFDIDNGELWISPDIGNVYRFNQATGQFSGPNPFLGGAGGYSGVERVDVGNSTYIIVVNDALNPRRLCVHDLTAALLGCQNFVNQRYEGLAFDGRYLWAADYFGNKIDKFDVLSDGGQSIFVPPSDIPEPSTVILTSAAVALLGMVKRHRGKHSA